MTEITQSQPALSTPSADDAEKAEAAFVLLVLLLLVGAVRQESRRVRNQRGRSN